MAAVSKKTQSEVIKDKAEKLMNGVALWVSYYRENPDKFCKDFLNLNLKTFQKILLYAMMHNYFFMFIAARGLGKTFLVSVYCVVQCILYPGSKIVISSKTLKQATEVLLKVTEDLCELHSWGSSNLKNEINWKDTKIGQNDAKIAFKNGSFMTVVTSNDNARSKRANIIVVDESRMVDLDVINTVLRRFLTAPRMPGYLNKPEYAHLQERNKEFYMSSAYYASSWMYQKAKSYFVNMLDDTKRYFICSLPYQISIKEGLLMRSQVEDEMSESDWNPITWSMEMESLFYGAGENAFFDYDSISKRRKIKSVFYPLELYKQRDIPVPKLAPNEIRILSVDVALMSSKKNNNDASSLMITSNIPIDEYKYNSNLVYLENQEGLTTDELGVIVMRTFYEYHCTDLVLDCNGLGLGVADYIAKDQFDPMTGKTYKGFKCCNDESMAERCKIKDPNTHFYSVKATAQFNNEICVLLRNGFQNNKISLPVHEFESEEFLKTQIKSFNKLTPKQQAMYKITYIQTSLMVNELINLDHEVKNGNIKIMEKSGMRKDRYSSLAYNFWLLTEIERKKKPYNKIGVNIADLLVSQTKLSSRKVGMFEK